MPRSESTAHMAESVPHSMKAAHHSAAPGGRLRRRSISPAPSNTAPARAPIGFDYARAARKKWKRVE